MTELERLLEERKSLNAKIKSLQSKEMKCGNVSLNYDNINTKTWRVSVFRPTIKGPYYKYAHGTVNVSVIIGENRDEVIEALPSLIKNLTDLYEAVSKEGEDGK